MKIVVSQLAQGIFAAALLASFPHGAIAQPPQGEESPQVRRQRELSDHDKRIREIIRARQDEARKRQDESRSNSGNTNTNTNQRQIDRATPELATNEAPPNPDVVRATIALEGADRGGTPVKTGRAFGATLLYYNFPTPIHERQLDTILATGEEFMSEIVLLNDGLADIDRLTLGLSYDKRFVEPVKVFDAQVRRYSSKTPTFQTDNRAGILYYDLEIDRPFSSRESTPIRIVWKAVRPTSYTSLNFVFDGDDPAVPLTAVYSGDKNVLGVGFDPIDGVLGGGVTIEASEKTTRRQLQGKESDLREMYLGEIGAHSFAGLVLTGADKSVHVGDVFPVDVQLNNPQGTLVDSIDFMLEWDPRVLEMVDKDRGNWVHRGINANDGPFTRSYPFDAVKYNEARNDRGQLRYSAGMTEGRALPSGTFARVYLRAKAPAATTSLRLLKGRPGEPNLTAVRYFGYEITSFEAPLTIPQVGVSVLAAPKGYVPVDASAPKPKAEPQPKAEAETEP